MPKFSKIHEAMKKLASLCDGAHARDGYGFNQRDTNFGHSLAEQQFLSVRQAPHAMRMCIFYKRQLSEYGFDLAELQAEFWAGISLRLGVAVTHTNGQYTAEVVTGFEDLPKRVWNVPAFAAGYPSQAEAINGLVSALKASNMTGKLYLVKKQAN